MRREVFRLHRDLSRSGSVINGELGPTTYMGAKIRCPRRDESGVETPFSIYMRFMKPAKVAGREVIWVDGKDDNKGVGP